MSLPTRRGPRFSTLLILLLLCSNLATALVAYFVIDRMNQRYAAELGATVPGLHEVMLLAHESTNTHRAALNLQLAGSDRERDENKVRLAEVRKRETQRLRQVFPEPPAESSPRAALWEAARAYSAHLEHYLAFIEGGEFGRAAEYRVASLRPAFDEYQRRQREESIRLSFEAMRSGAEIHAFAITQKGLLLGFGVGPLILLCVTLVLAGVLGGWLWHSMRQYSSTADGRPAEEEARF